MTINEIQDEIIEEFSEIEDWMDRYQLIIDLGEEGDVLPAGEKNESNLIDGCQSRVWIVCDQNPDGTLTFRGESDALIVKGLVCLLLRVVNGHTPEEIRDADLYFYSADRSGRKPFADAFQRIARHDQAHQGLCRCAQRLIRHSLFPLSHGCVLKKRFSPARNSVLGRRNCFSAKKSTVFLGCFQNMHYLCTRKRKGSPTSERYPPK